MSNLSGQELKGYELRERIGSGGFGAVYRAYQPIVGREVAIKVILPDHANQPEFIRRFESEARLVAQLESLHIVPLYDYWRDPTGAFLVMRWLRGGSLEGLIEKTGAWTAEASSRLLEQIASALAVAHRKGIVHRDLKPANILLDEDRNGYLSDFGIAKSLGATGEDKEEGLTGSPAYMSPEQIRQTPVTPQTDIYSLGLVLYEVLTGQQAFSGSTSSELLLKHLSEPVPTLRDLKPDLSNALNRVIQKATEKDPAQRYTDVLLMYADFRQAVFSATQTGGILIGEGPIQTIEILDIEPESFLEVVNPYKGLRAFQEGDADDFFGRDALTQQLIQRLAEMGPLSRFLAVVGPSGSGKSSVVKAGLMPELRRNALPGSGKWFYVEMVPRSHPIEELTTALLKVAVNEQPDLQARLSRNDRGLVEVLKTLLPEKAELVLFIDQFEEVFTQVEDEAERTRFLNSLRIAMSTPNTPIRLLITLRADFYDRPLLYQEFGDLMRQRTEVVLPLSSEELEQAIVKPSERLGVMLQPELIAAILKDVGEQPGTLPLLQYALTELFERRQGRTLTLEAYTSSGGVLGALARRADEIYGEMDAASQEVIRQLFLRLVTLGEGVEDTRRRVKLSELASIVKDKKVLEQVIDTYSKYRLLTFDRDPITRGPTVEVAHEALIRTWKRLREWLNNSRENLRLQRQIQTAATEWSDSGHDPSFLAYGVRLSQFETLIGADLALNQDEITYLESSIAEREKQRAQEEARRQRELTLAKQATESAQQAAESAKQTVVAQRRAAQRLRVLIAFLAVAMVGALILTGIAVNAQKRAEEQRQIAEEQQHIAEANQHRANALRLASDAGQQLPAGSNNAEFAGLLAVRSLKDVYTSEGDAALTKSVGLMYTLKVFKGHTNFVFAVAFSPDGKTVASGSSDQTVKLWDVATGKVLKEFKGDGGRVYALAFSPNGTMILTGTQNNKAQLWDITTGNLIREFTGHTNRVYAVAFSPDGKTILTGSQDKTARLWDVATGNLLHELKGHTSRVAGVAFSPDGKSAATGGFDDTIRLWDVATGMPIPGKIFTDTRNVNSIMFSLDGKMILSGGLDQIAKLWDVQTGKELRRFQGHQGQIYSVAFSPDGKTILTASADGTADLWNAATGSEIRTLSGHTGGVDQAVFSPDGTTVLTGSDDTNLRLWDAAYGPELRTFAEKDRVESAAFSHDGAKVVTANYDHDIKLWNTATRLPLLTLSGHTDIVDNAVFSPDDKYILSGSDDHTVRLWDAVTGQQLRVFSGHSDAVFLVAFSPDGRQAVSASTDKTVRLWDIATGATLWIFKGHSKGVTSVAFSPDGKMIATGSQDNTARLLDTATGTEIKQFKDHTSTLSAAIFSPDGKSLLTASYDNTAILWDIATGAKQHTFGGHSSSVFSAAFSPDGKFALTGSADNTAKIWNIATGEEVRTLYGHADTIYSVAFSPDGKFALTGSADNTARLWDVDPHDLITFVCTRVFRDFTDLERSDKQFKIGDNEPTCPQFGTLSQPLPATATPNPTGTIPVFTALPTPTITPTHAPTIVLLKPEVNP